MQTYFGRYRSLLRFNRSQHRSSSSYVFTIPEGTNFFHEIFFAFFSTRYRGFPDSTIFAHPGNHTMIVFFLQKNEITICFTFTGSSDFLNILITPSFQTIEIGEKFSQTFDHVFHVYLIRGLKKKAKKKNFAVAFFLNPLYPF